MKFEIKNRFDLKVIFECEADSLKLAVEMAVEKKVVLDGANLSGANLRGANLSGANLDGANLSGAYLCGAYLCGANLSGANLSGAYLSGANLSGTYLRGTYLRGTYLRGANLSGANLRGANLRGAYLDGAYLSGANLDGANLDGAYLDGANLDEIKKDFFKKLAIAKDEVVGLYKSLLDGKVNGSSYEGECACFVGTIANVRNEVYNKLTIDLVPDSNSPTERWFMAIRKGDTPENNPVSEIVAEWIREFSKENSVNLPERVVTWK